MKFCVGYNNNSGSDFIDYIIKNRNKVYEVYFSWGDMPNGRGIGTDNNELSWVALQRQIKALKSLKKAGINLNLLLNANCYGAESLSRIFFENLGNTVDYIKNNFGLSSITTTSFTIAKFINNNFENINIRASVNMSMNDVPSFEYAKEYFDSFYLGRECNRNAEKIKQIYIWCKENGKELFMLANSGCLNFCSAHTYHDNLVAHESELSKIDNAYNFEGICWNYLAKNQVSIIKDTNFIRPEDIDLYSECFTAVKLATRTNRNPLGILKAYFEKSYKGNITDILEPSHSGIFYPKIIENSNIAKDFTKKVSSCKKNCDECSYCEQVFNSSVVNLEEKFC